MKRVNKIFIVGAVTIAVVLVIGLITTFHSTPTPAAVSGIEPFGGFPLSY